MSIYDEAYQSNENSEWLKAADFPRGVEAVLTIESHEAVDFTKEGQEKQPIKCGIKFQGKEAGIVLNNQNFRRLREGLGNEPDEWVGRDVNVGTELIASGQYAGNYMFVVKPVSEVADAEDIPF